MNIDTATKNQLNNTNAAIQAAMNSTLKLDNRFIGGSSFENAMKEVNSSETQENTDNQTEIAETDNSASIAKVNKAKNIEKSSKIEQSEDVTAANSGEIASAEGEFAKELHSNGVNYTDFKYGNQSQELLNQNIKELLNTRNSINNNNGTSVKSSSFLNDEFSNTLSYSKLNMTEDDANFFIKLTQNSDKTMQDVMKELQGTAEAKAQNIQKNAKMSEALFNTLQEGLKTNKPFRIDFDNNMAVVLQVDKNGAVSANFIPGDKVVEQYLRNNIDYLRQNFEKEDIPYNQLSYSQSKEQEQENKNKRNKKENE